MPVSPLPLPLRWWKLDPGPNRGLSIATPGARRWPLKLSACTVADSDFGATTLMLPLTDSAVTLPPSASPTCRFALPETVVLDSRRTRSPGLSTVLLPDTVSASHRPSRRPQRVILRL